uniref:Uncharacterized protein n=2 Tax=Cajanus cajan TaxID=3821 RepID=A0A151RF83_CAJCA|nr:hypothetical protein KK1_037419 [Cajanus cajan]
MAQMGVLPGPEVVVGEAATAVAQLAGLEFLLVDSRQREFARVLTVARVSPRGAVLVCKNAHERNFSGVFRWNLVLRQDVPFERSVFLPFGNGVDIAYIAAPPIPSNL